MAKQHQASLSVVAALTLLTPFASLGQELQTSAATKPCEVSASHCQDLQKADQLSEFKPLPSTLCQSLTGLCWHQDGANRQVNWRLTRELYGSTSAGSNWGDWRQASTKARISEWNHCQRREGDKIVYQGTCRIQETWPQSESKTLEIVLGNAERLSFRWDRGGYWLKSGSKKSPLLIHDQGSRHALQWSNSMLLAAKRPSDLNALPDIPNATDQELEAQLLGSTP